MKGCKQIRVTGRGLIVHEKQLLFVSDNDRIWYIPGGRQEPGESLPECVQREVYEETGLTVAVRELFALYECFDLSRQAHRVICYFRTELQSAALLRDDWQDKETVRYRRFFDLESIRNSLVHLPRFLAKGTWLQSSSDREPVIYQGQSYMKDDHLYEHEFALPGLA